MDFLSSLNQGYPVNAQFILNEWLFIKTADNEEGFVPYVCCRPMLRRQSVKNPNEIENFYKPYDFESNKTKSPSTSNPTATPPNSKKFSISSTLGSQSILFQNSFSTRKRSDVTSSSCGGDSGFSDCESSSHHHHHHQNHRSFDFSTQRYTRLSNIRSLRSSSNSSKKSDVFIQEHLGKKSVPSLNQTIISRLNGSSRIKSQLSISSNSAFTQFVKNNIKQSSQHDR